MDQNHEGHLDPLQITAHVIETPKPLLHLLHSLLPFAEMEADFLESTLKQGLSRCGGFAEGVDQP